MINKKRKLNENAHWMFSKKKVLENKIIIAGKMCTIMLHNNGFKLVKVRDRERDGFIINN